MDSSHLVDPEIVPILDLIPSLGLSTPGRLEEIRAMFGVLPAAEPTPGVTTEERSVEGAAGDPAVRVLVSRPSETTTGAPALVWIHGGGYVLGSVEMNQGFVDQLVGELGAVVVSVDYRLAPETRAPGSAEDCYAALRWLHANAVDLGVDPARIAIAGESAGGGLAAALGQLSRDRGEIPICLAVLVYPMLDDRTAVTDDPNPYSGQFIWSPPDNAFGWEALLGRAPGSEEVAPYAAAARTEDLAGLSATFIAVGALDLFVDEDVEYARRLLRAGVPTELHVYPGAFHGFLGFEGSTLSSSLRTAMLAALRRSFS